ncbi:MAG: TIGR04551 family protein [Deltaproteobacteria bacterium]|nr:TIGR04551 family protein [Deltaproteobacteria bacterium]
MRSLQMQTLAIGALVVLACPVSLRAQDEASAGQEDSAAADEDAKKEEAPKAKGAQPVPGEQPPAPGEQPPEPDEPPPLPPASEPAPLPEPAPGLGQAPLEGASGSGQMPLAGGGLPPPPPGFSEVAMDEASPAKPPLNLLDLHGYFRLRGDLMDGLDLGLYPRSDLERGAYYPQFPRSATNRTDTLAGANMRFRLEPTVNISEDVRINAQIDMLDNLVLGSTPEGYPKSAYYPLVAFSQGQAPPQAGLNSIRDSILVKRVWGEVMTPLGLLRFGRMGSQWGLGLLANDGGPAHVDGGPLVTRKDPFSPVGHCFDCDYGSTADRIMFITKVFGHYIVPMIDFTAEGPTFTRVNEWGGQPFDFDQLDDVNSYILAVTKRDKPEDIAQALAQGDWNLNYGVYFVFRNQALDAIEYHNSNAAATPGANQDIEDYAVRNVEAYIPDVWLRFMMGKLRIEVEFVMVIGKIGYDAQGRSLNADGELISTLAGERIDLLQWGGVIQADYKFMNDQLIVGAEFGIASGDDSPGFGVRPFDEKQFEHNQGDHDINNFRFHPDYHVDMILWRQIIGTVTDAFYLKPSVQYNIAEGFGGKVSAVYSQALFESSTRGKAAPLGLEFDVDLFYFSDDNFHAGLSYGILIPFGGMNDLGDDEAPGGIADQELDDDAEIAHRVMGRLVIHF